MIGLPAPSLLISEPFESSRLRPVMDWELPSRGTKLEPNLSAPVLIAKLPVFKLILVVPALVNAVFGPSGPAKGKLSSSKTKGFELVA